MGITSKTGSDPNDICRNENGGNGDLAFGQAAKGSFLRLNGMMESGSKQNRPPMNADKRGS
jgi:hypothetical protein